MGWSEERLHRWLATRPRPARLAGSAGHDAAVLEPLDGSPVACADATVCGVHFEPGTAPERAGAKAAGRVLSDLAACGARPRALLLALLAPADTDEAWMRAAIEAVDAFGRAHGAALVGGDLTAVEGPLALAVTGLGVLDRGLEAPGRDRARPGDVVLLTGPVGGSSLGRHLAIEPRLVEGRRLLGAGARVLMDVSDGLARDLARIARASGVRIDLERVPVHADAHARSAASGRTARAHALEDGEDHELLACLSAARWEAARAELCAACPRLVSVGRVREGRDLWLAPEDGGTLAPWDGRGGWTHGA